MNNLRFKITIGNDKKYRFTLLLGDRLVVTDKKQYESVVDTLEGIKQFNFIIDETFEILTDVDEIIKYETGSSPE